MAPSKAIFDYVVKGFETYMEIHASVRPSDLDSKATDEESEAQYDDSDEHVDLIEFPSEGSNMEIIFWVILFPLRFLMHYTVPDVRQQDGDGEATSTIGQAYLATFMCLLWLVVGSYSMVASLEALAELMDIPDAVVGVTVSAAGMLCSVKCTSFFFSFRLMLWFLAYRYFLAELHCIQSGGRKWVRKSSRFECVWLEYLQYHGRVGVAMGVVHKLRNWFRAVQWAEG
jgi:hypothetical protein